MPELFVVWCKQRGRWSRVSQPVTRAEANQMRAVAMLHVPYGGDREYFVYDQHRTPQGA